MESNVQTMTDEDLKKYQRQVLKVCAFCENGIRIKITTPKFCELAQRAAAVLSEIESEFFRRHPEEQQNRNQQFMRACEILIDNHNFDEFGTDPNAVWVEYFTEYNKPEAGKKTVSCRKTFVHEGELSQKQTTQAVYSMKPIDYLFSAIENAMDEFSETLPDVPAGK